jgi:hypothetical protein
LAEIAKCAVRRVYPPVVRDVVPVVAKRGRVVRQEPKRCDSQLLEIVESGDQTRKIADPISVGVLKGPDMELVDDSVLVPMLEILYPRLSRSDCM